MSWYRIWALVGVLGLAPAQAHALATFTITTTGSGFSDATPTRPVGGNAGVTLGEQRRLALTRALETWGKLLDSAVPIVVEASFEDLNCSVDGAVLAQAAPRRLFADLPGRTKFWYPSPLADRLTSRDLSPGDADLHIAFNSALDGSCEASVGGWYYGFDTAAGEQNGLIATALHELAHGLGFASWVNLSTGSPRIPGQLDVFTAHVLDLDVGKSWAELSEAQRALSATNVRRVVWDGPAAQRAALDFLEPGVPNLTLEPPLSGFRGWIGDASGTLNPAQHPVRGRVVLAQPSDGCTALRGDVKDAVVLLLLSEACPWVSAARNVAAAGAAAALFVTGGSNDAARPLEASAADAVALPIASLSVGDGRLLSAAVSAGRGMVATLGGEQTRLLGADAQGRPLLFSPFPVQRGSSISHFDPLTRPNLLLEPYAQPEERPEVDPVTLAVLHDIGWTWCGNGRVDADEQCDDGMSNADRAGVPCRLDCQLPACGDAILDASEVCDDGKANSDLVPDACRKTCVRARCGDSVVDKGEACDKGSANSDALANACRSTCAVARCGDSVVDTGEVCDQGANNDDVRPNACRKNCRAARCGDGIVDDGEQCDGTADCSPTCMLVMHTEDAAVPMSSAAPTAERDDDDGSAWLDPWDAPNSDKPKAKKSDGCSALVGAPAKNGQVRFFVLILGLALARRRAARLRSDRGRERS